MRPGDLVAFKDGLFGIRSPHNLGIFLERRKRKKEFFAVLVTTKGVREVKPDHVSARRFRATVDPASPENELVARLQDLIAQAADGKLDATDDDAKELEERQVWERLVNVSTEARSVQAWADALHDGRPSKGDVRRLEKLFEGCRRPGLGFFERVGRNEWRPIPVADMKAFQQALERVGRLRNTLVQIEVVTDDSGEEWERLVGRHPDEVDLEPEARALLDAVGEGMAAAVLHDRWPDDVTPPGCPIHTLMGRQYHRSLEYLARDWTGAVGTSRSSVLVQFLVDTGLVTVQDAIRLIAQRKVLAAEGFGWETPEHIEQRAADAQEPAEAARADPELYAPRRDLRDLETYTIDPPDAKDFDDAVSLLDREGGGHSLWVHIADVSHYVEKDGAIDRHARERGTSVYLPTGVLPMLPTRLSDDLCSLRDGTDRLAMSVRLDIDASGHVVAWEPAETVIRVDRNLSYQHVDAAIERGEGPFSHLHALAERMRQTRSGLAIETGEVRIRFAQGAAHEAARRGGLQGAHDSPDDDIGLNIEVKRSSPATRMIETFMVAANEAVSRFVSDKGVPVPYRCHPLPERAKAERFTAQAKVMGLDIELELPDDEPSGGAAGADVDSDEGADDGPSILDQLAGGKLQLGGFAASETVGSRKDDPAEAAPAADEETAPTGSPAIRGLAQLDAAQQEAWLAPFRSALESIEQVADEGARDLANQKFLGTLGRAFYTPHNMGHFGLGSSSYAHFTSPIRRYPDLMLHRQLRWVLRREAGFEVGDEPPHAGQHLERFCETSSAQAEAAERLERGMLDCCLTFESRRPSWQDRLRGVVNGVSPGGIFLTLPGELEARLSMRDLPGGPYEADEHGAYLFRAVLPGGARAVPDPEEEARMAELPWRDLEDPDTGELREVRVRLGDVVGVRIRDRDFVDGKVSVRLSDG